MRRVLLGGALALVLLPASASGRATIEGPGQGIVDRARVPTPEATLTVTTDPGGVCPDDAAACTDPTNGVIYLRALDLSSPFGRLALLHEIGHNFDYLYLDDWERGRYAALIGGEWDSEDFADTYAACASNRAYPPRMWGFQPSQHHPEITVRGSRMRQLCTFIVRSYWR